MALLALATSLIGIGLVLLAGIAVRVYTILPRHRVGTSRDALRKGDETCSIAVFLGSGGHTSEMCSLLSTLPFERYTPRTYIYCHGDEMSLRAVARLESAKGTSRSDTYTLLPLPRARRVAQPLLSTAFSAAHTLLASIWHLFLGPLVSHPTRPYADLMLVNGPGTCVPLVLVAWIRRVLGLPYTKIIYVESFARVRSLSLSAKLVRPLVDRFVVQWPDAGSGSGGRADCKGWLV